MAPHLNQIGVVGSSYPSSSASLLQLRSLQVRMQRRCETQALLREYEQQRRRLMALPRRTLPNAHTSARIFTASLQSSLETVGGLQAHALAIKISGFYDVFVGSSLLNMYCKFGCLLDAYKVFDLLLGLL
ncbi:Pentatricopeptide repeat-containing protein, partial [Cucurbita argyrosperma subsp. sororia]